MKYTSNLVASFALISALGMGCNSSSSAPSSGTGTTLTSVTQSETSVSVSSATLLQCPYGGVLVQTFTDLNHDGTLDSGDPILSSTPVCNGVNGKSTGIQVTQANSTSCPNGGYQFETFLDVNNTGVFASGDTVLSTSTVCNGSNGANGTNGTNGVNGNSFSFSQAAASANECSAGGVVYTVEEFDGNGAQVAGATNSFIVCNGTNGVNGTSAVFTTVAASAEQCSNGGNVLLMASDTAGTGVYAPTDANQESVVVCNGANGAQGPAGAVSSFAAIATIQPCGAASSPYKEVLLCLADGNILSDFSDDASGTNTRLAFVQTGTFEDTDSSGCVFSVNSDGDGGLTVAWSAGSNQYASWNAGSYDCKASSN